MKTKIEKIVLVVVVSLLQISWSNGMQARSLKTLKRMNARDYFENPLQVQFAEAVAAGDEIQMRELLQKGADVNAIGNDDMRPLFWAILKHSPRGFEFLLRNEADPNFYMIDRDNFPHKLKPSLMKFLAEADAAEYLKLALKYGGDPNFLVESYYPDGRLSSRNTIISEAIRSSKLENIRILINAGADLNYQDFSGSTPIMTAARVNKFDMVYLFLEHGADARIKNPKEHGLVEIIKMFGDRGVKANSEQHLWYLKVVQELKHQGLLEENFK